MNKMYAADKKVKPYLDQYHRLIWMGSNFLDEIKCEHITNNFLEVWNKWVKDINTFSS